MTRIKPWAILGVVLACLLTPVQGDRESLERDEKQDVVLERLEDDLAEVKATTHGNALLLKAMNENINTLVDHDYKHNADLRVVETKLIGASVGISFIMTLIGGAVLKTYIKEKK